jgi:competence protein ComEA
VGSIGRAAGPSLIDPDSQASEQSQPGGGGRWLVPALVAVGGALAGAGVVMLMALALVAVPTTDIIGVVGEPLVGEPLVGGDTATGAWTIPADEIVVDVAGAVVRPGLQRLRAGDRVGDAIDAAGGFSAGVDLAEAGRALNLAQPLVDGGKVLVPELGFQASPAESGSDGRIDINRADRSTLETLPGIGPVTAGRIVDSRRQERFTSVAELRSRGIVGDAVFERIRDQVRVGH